MTDLSCLVCQHCFLGLNQGSGLFICFGKESASVLCAFSAAWTLLFKLLFSMKVLQIPLLLWCKRGMSYPIAWALIIVKCFVFSHPSHYLPCAVPEEEPPLFSWADTLGSLMPQHCVQHPPVFECACRVWELQTGWDPGFSTTHPICQVKADKCHLLLCNQTTYHTKVITKQNHTKVIWSETLVVYVSLVWMS